MSAAIVSAAEPPFVKFPPFPTAPPGVAIMPFKDFRPRGIQLFSEHNLDQGNESHHHGGDADAGNGNDDDAEFDALGIPTVELRIKHATDECKSSSRKKRKKKKAAAATTAIEAVPVKKLPWYEEWEEGEDLRVTKERYDSRTIPPVDRLFQCAFDFRTGRPWPPVASGLNNLWDQFRLFTGLLVNPSVFRKAETKNSARAESPDFESDDENDDHHLATNAGVSDGPTSARPSKRQRSDNDDDDFDVGDEDGAFDDPHRQDEEAREEKITIFLSDPEKAIRIFLSSHMREQGLIWSERNLNYMPRLVAFFLAFVLRNRVLPEPRYQRGLRRALEVIEWATKELPLTHKVGQSIPDAFNEACRECFGRKGGINWSFVGSTAVTAEQQQKGKEMIRTPRRILALSHMYTAVNPGDVVTDVTHGTEINVALPSDDAMQLKQVIEDNVDMEDVVVTPSAVWSPIKEQSNGGGNGGWNSSGWGGGGWGDGGSLDNNPWAQEGTTWDNNNNNENNNNNNDSEVKDGKDGTGLGNEPAWADSKPTWNRDPASLFSLLGPSVFPLTHTTGIVEYSTRRVAAIHFPPGHPKAETSANASTAAAATALDDAEVVQRPNEKWRPSASGVEADLHMRFAKVILEPWGRVEGDISRPEICWATSRGPVVDPGDGGVGRTAFEPLADDAGASVGRKPHDPLKDSITLLVTPAFAETLTLVPGLGLGAMWIEITRREGNRDEEEEEEEGITHANAGSASRIWYHEDVTGIFPSFYTTQAKE